MAHEQTVESVFIKCFPCSGKEVFSMNLDRHIHEKLCSLAQQYHIEKIILFGSRARESNHEHSDIDLAVYGITNAACYLDFQEAIEEQIPTLLRFDLADMNGISV